MKAKFVDTTGRIVVFEGDVLLVVKASQYALGQGYELVDYSYNPEDKPNLIIIMSGGMARQLELPWPAETAFNAREDVIALSSYRDMKSFLDNVFHLLIHDYKVIASN